jgi:hypothetical protein
MSRTPQIFLVVIVLVPLLVIVAFPRLSPLRPHPQNLLPTFQFLLSNSSTPLPLVVVKFRVDPSPGP